MKPNLLFVLFALTTLLLSGCSLWPFGGKDEKAEQIDTIVSAVKEINEKLPPMEPMVLRVSGYGAMNPQATHLSEIQRRLIAMRASKLDAYRSLAERVYGTQITGVSTVENLVIQNDRFRTYVDTQIMGARVVYQGPLTGGGFETIVEMVIDQGFRNCLTNEPNGRRNTSCAADAVHDLEALTRNQLKQQGIDPQANSGLYFIE